MEASELRLNNLVYDTKGNVNLVCVETFLKFNNQIQPIPLTEDWLKKLGFINQIIKFKNDDELELDFDGDICHVFYTQIDLFNQIDKVLFSRKIKYIHELQNLYFALVGEELEFKINTI